MEGHVEIGSLFSTPCDSAFEYLQQHSKLRNKIGIDMVIGHMEMSTITVASSQTEARLQTCMDALHTTSTPMDLDEFFDPEFMGYILSRNRERQLNLNPDIDRTNVDQRGLQDYLSAATVEVASKIFGGTIHGSNERRFAWLLSDDRTMLVPLYISLLKASPFEQSATHLLDLTQKRLTELPSLKDQFEAIHIKMSTQMVQVKGVDRNKQLLETIQDFYELQRNFSGASDILEKFHSLGLSINDSRLVEALNNFSHKDVYEALQGGIRYPTIDSDDTMFEEIYQDVESTAVSFNQLSDFSREVIPAVRSDIPVIGKIVEKVSGEKDTAYIKRIRFETEMKWDERQKELHSFIKSGMTQDDWEDHPEKILKTINELCGLSLQAAPPNAMELSFMKDAIDDSSRAILESRDPRLTMFALGRKTLIAVPERNMVYEYRYTDGEMTHEYELTDGVNSDLVEPHVSVLTLEQYETFLKMMRVMNSLI